GLVAGARRPGLGADADELVPRLEHRVRLAPHVRDVLALVLRGDLAELDELLRGRVVARGIDEGRADPERARLHLLADEVAHRVELRRRRVALVESDDVRAKRRRSAV